MNTGETSKADNLFVSGQKEQAVEIYLEEIRKNNSLPEKSLQYLASFLIEKQLYKEAIDCHKALLEINYSNAITQHNIGYLYLQTCDIKAAIEHLNLAIEIDPGQPLFHYNLGNSYRLGSFKHEALDAYKKAISLDPNNGEYWSAIGSLQSMLKQNKEASESFNKAIKSDPLNPLFQLNLSNHCLRLESFAEAINAAEAALTLNPSLIEGYDLLAKALLETDKESDAVNAALNGLAKAPQDQRLLITLFSAYNAKGEFNKANKAIQMAFEIDPSNSDVLYNIARQKLTHQDFKLGWKHYEQRWLINNEIWSNEYSSIMHSRPKWEGSKTTERLILWPEQGIGDEVMFSSAINDIFLLAPNLVVAVDARLLSLFRRSFHGSIRFVGKEESISALQEADQQASIATALGLVRPHQNSFKIASKGYLKADKDHADKIRTNVLKGENKRMIGLSWTSKGSRIFNKGKCVSLKQLIGAFSALETTFVSLQYTDSKNEIKELQTTQGITVIEMNDIDLFHDVDGLTSVISACDEIVTVSNINAHIAGALGIPCTVLLPMNCHWRWGRQGESCPWYQSVRLLRQIEPGNWNAPLEKLKQSFESRP